MQSFAKMFVWIVVIAGSAILCLILALTIRNRYYEIGVLLSLGQSKVKIIAQQLIEVGLIAVVAFVISLGTGQLTSHYMGNMLEVVLLQMSCKWVKKEINQMTIKINQIVINKKTIHKQKKIPRKYDSRTIKSGIRCFDYR